MSVAKDDVWAMYALWHRRSGITGNVYATRRALRGWVVGGFFKDDKEYRNLCGKNKPYSIVRVDVKREDA